MEELFTVEINEESFPTLEDCTKETEISLVIVRCGSDWVELTIESNEPDNDDEDGIYQEPTYIVWIYNQGDCKDRLVHPLPFEKMEVREIVHSLIDIYMDVCR